MRLFELFALFVGKLHRLTATVECSPVVVRAVSHRGLINKRVGDLIYDLGTGKPHASTLRLEALLG